MMTRQRKTTHLHDEAAAVVAAADADAAVELHHLVQLARQVRVICARHNTAHATITIASHDRIVTTATGDTIQKGTRSK